jgi:hypothetical protein
VGARMWWVGGGGAWRRRVWRRVRRRAGRAVSRRARGVSSAAGSQFSPRGQLEAGRVGMGPLSWVSHQCKGTQRACAADPGGARRAVNHPPLPPPHVPLMPQHPSGRRHPRALYLRRHPQLVPVLAAALISSVPLCARPPAEPPALGRRRRNTPGAPAPRGAPPLAPIAREDAPDPPASRAACATDAVIRQPMHAPMQGMAAARRRRAHPGCTPRQSTIARSHGPQALRRRTRARRSDVCPTRSLVKDLHRPPRARRTQTAASPRRATARRRPAAARRRAPPGPPPRPQHRGGAADARCKAHNRPHDDPRRVGRAPGPAGKEKRWWRPRARALGCRPVRGKAWGKRKRRTNLQSSVPAPPPHAVA